MAEASFLESDQAQNAPHPRERYVLHGHDEAQKSFLEACQSGRLHHAWLIGGPEGIGKATFAYRITRALLASGPDLTHLKTLDVSPQNAASRRLAAQSHPDVHILRRGLARDKKSLASAIAVEDVRDLLRRLSETASEGGYKICIVDTADDLNISSANALLKMIEEPPEKTVFFLISHRPGGLLPTIRSRCRTIRLSPLTENDLLKTLESLDPNLVPHESSVREKILKRSDGSVRQVLNLLHPETLKLITNLTDMLNALPKLDMRRLLELAESLARKEAGDDFLILVSTIQHWLNDRLHRLKEQRASDLLPLVGAWDSLTRQAQDILTLHLDKRAFLLSIFHELATATRTPHA